MDNTAHKTGMSRECNREGDTGGLRGVFSFESVVIQYMIQLLHIIISNTSEMSDS